MPDGQENQNQEEGNGEQKTDFGTIRPTKIEEEMRSAYLDYAMSVIVSRALPDVRDGLKPVHRRILYAMHQMGLGHSSKYRKSAAVTGEVLAKYHPHGDIAVYDSLVRMAQDFAMRYPLVDGQGNFGCFTEDTKVRLTDGRSLTFRELIKEAKKDKRNYTYTFNPKTRRIEIAEIKNPRLTKKNQKIMKVILDNRKEIKCTLNHLFMLRDGTYKEAKDLKPEDSLMPAYFNMRQIKDCNHYLSVLQPFTGRYEFVHKLADEYNERCGWVKKNSRSHILHHKDFNRWNNSPENIIRLSWKQHHKTHLNQVKNLWRERGNEFREKQRQSLREYFSRPEIRKELSERTKRLWKNPVYRGKYSQDHFSKMAKELWKNSTIKEFHRKKILQQRQNLEFIRRNKEAVRFYDKERLKINPDFMKELAEKAKISLHKKWQNPAYKERVIKSKILGFVYSLSKKYSKVTPEIYGKERYNNCFPKIENALRYFNNFSDIIKLSKKYNHKVIQIQILQKRKDVYDLTIEPWHNFFLDAEVFVHNSIDGDSAAAMRYSEARMTPISEELLADIEKETIPFMDNYDGTIKEPVVLPAKLPNLLLNGTMGIAVGMATNIPPHNVSEVLDAAVHLIDNPEATTEDFLKFIKGPDFPTGGIIYDFKEIKEAYATGKGKIVIRGVAEITESEKKSQRIIISEIPYGVNKADLVSKIADLAKNKKIEGIADLRDESDREGIRIVLDLKRDAFPQKILNALFKYTQLQETFHLNMLALVDGLLPRVLTLKMVLEEWLKHRREVITKRCQFELKRAKERAHILEGLKKALEHLETVIQTIKTSETRESAAKNLIKKFGLDGIQANAILEMRLSALATLERKKILDELKEKLALIATLADILAHPEKILNIIKKETIELKEKYGDERKTKVIRGAVGTLSDSDLIPNEEVIITLTTSNYIKRTPVGLYRSQGRGGKGVMGMGVNEEDGVKHLLATYNLDSILFFTNLGRVFQTKVYEIPAASKIAKGTALVNLISLGPEEKVTSVIPIKENQAGYLFMATKKGRVKKTPLSAYQAVRKNGLITIRLEKADELDWVRVTSGDDEIIIVTKNGLGIRFKEKNARPMGRATQGVIGMKLKGDDQVVGMDIATKDHDLLIVSENGLGKRTPVRLFKTQSRGGLGIISQRVNEKTGKVVCGHVTSSEVKDVILVSKLGQIIRIPYKKIPYLGRATQGVRLMRLNQKDRLASVTFVLKEKEMEEEQEIKEKPKVKVHTYKAASPAKTAPKIKVHSYLEPKRGEMKREPLSKPLFEKRQIKPRPKPRPTPDILKQAKSQSKPQEGEANYWGADKTVWKKK